MQENLEEPTMSRARRSILNYLTGLGLTGLTLLLSLIATPLLLRWLGQEKLGAFRAASDWGSYLTLLELGLGGALLPLIARQVSSTDSESQLGAVMSSSFRAYRRVTALTLLIGAVLIVVIPFLVPVRPESRIDLRIGTALAVLSSIFLLLSPLRPLWEADQRGYIVNFSLTIQAIVIISVGVLLPWI